MRELREAAAEFKSVSQFPWRGSVAALTKRRWLISRET